MGIGIGYGVHASGIWRFGVFHFDWNGPQFVSMTLGAPPAPPSALRGSSRTDSVVLSTVEGGRVVRFSIHDKVLNVDFAIRWALIGSIST